MPTAENRRRKTRRNDVMAISLRVWVAGLGNSFARLRAPSRAGESRQAHGGQNQRRAHSESSAIHAARPLCAVAAPHQRQPGSSPERPCSSTPLAPPCTRTPFLLLTAHSFRPSPLPP